MATLLDGILERHQGPEPRVVAHDVQAILKTIIKPESDDDGASVSLIAERADVSTRTVYRVLQGKKLVNEVDPQEPQDGPQTHTLSLDLADRLCLAAGRHLLACRLKWPGEPDNITAYVQSHPPLAAV